MYCPSTHSQYEKHPFLLKSRLDKTDPISPVQEPREKLEEDAAFDQVVRCRMCGHLITHGIEAFSINGSHEHVFANPHGLVFETVCYKRAMGCVVTGVPSKEFTWFSGYEWQIALCGGCFSHLGWRFISSTSSFFCLISHHLIFF